MSGTGFRTAKIKKVVPELERLKFWNCGITDHEKLLFYVRIFPSSLRKTG